MSEITSIVYKPKQADDTQPDRFSRQPLDEARLVENHGIEGDRKGGHPKRQLNVMSAERLEEMHAEGFNTTPGQMGEQLVIKGVDVESLAPGTRLQIGDRAHIEVVELRTGCERLERVQGISRDRTVGRLGVMARVVTAGTIRVGDSVAVVGSKAGHV